MVNTCPAVLPIPRLKGPLLTVWLFCFYIQLENVLHCRICSSDCSVHLIQSADRQSISWEHKQGGWCTGGVHTGAALQWVLGAGCNFHSASVVEQVAGGP